MNRRRDHGGVIFIDLRDRAGLAQIVFDPDNAAFATAERLRNEFCIRVTGLVRERPAGTANAELASGEIEVLCKEVEILNASVTPPFQLDDDNLSETTRLTHRVLDLRRPQMQRNLMLRYRVSIEVRKFLDQLGFIDIETPMLTKSTPEGARDYGALARERRPLLRAAAVAAAVQADADGVGLRPLLPDHQVLPRRRPARRPSAGIHPDRLRNLVPERTRDPRDLREHDPPRVQGGAGRGPAVAVPDHDLDRSHAPLRLGQAGPAREPGIHRHDRRHARRGLQGLRRRRHGAGQPRGRPARAGRGRDVAQRDRRLHAVRRYLRRQGPGLHQGQRSGQGPRRPAIAHRQEPA